jgi:methionyl-tRNA formyltransferase
MDIKLLGRGELFKLSSDCLRQKGHRFVDKGYDLIVLANHNVILKKEDYANVKYGAINLHSGRLPQYRGSSVLNWQIINGEEWVYASIIQVDEGIDTGDILACDGIKIKPTDVIQEIRPKLYQLFMDLLSEAIKDIEDGSLHPIKQESVYGEARYWHHRLPQDSKILWDKYTDFQVHNLVRASENPYNAFSHVYDVVNDRMEYVQMCKVKLADEWIMGVPGRVARKVNGNPVVICANRGIEIVQSSRLLNVGDQLW